MPPNLTEMSDDWHIAGEDTQNRLTANDYFDKVRKYLPTRPHRFLEVGGAFGWFAERVQKVFGATILLVEPSRSAVQGATARGIPAHVACIEDFQADDPFDVVFAAHVVEHVSDVNEFWKACNRLLKPGGRMILLTPNGSAWKFKVQGERWGWAVPASHTLFLNAESTRRLMEKHGFAEVAIRSYCPHNMHYPLMLVHWLAARRARRLSEKETVSTSKLKTAVRPRVVRTRGMMRLLTRPLVWTELALLRFLDALLGSERKDELRIVAEKIRSTPVPIR